MRKVEVLGVRVEMPTNQPIVLLRDLDSGRQVPIWIGAPEASAIAYAQQGVEPPRPLTHDLLCDVVTQLGHRLSEVRITRLEESIFHAQLVLDDGATMVEARASDAIALALRSEVPILVADEVLDEAGVILPEADDDEAPADTDTEVARFREFLDHVSAEDFEEPPTDSPEKQ